MHLSKVFITKTLIISLLLFVEALLLGNYLYLFSASKSYLSLNWEFFALIGGMLLLLAYTYALSVGAWDTWLQFVIVPVPISLANSLIIARIDYTYALISFFISYFLITYDVLVASQLKEQLIRFNPKFILRFSTKGLLFSFAIVAGIFVYFTPVTLGELNIVENVAQAVNSQLGNTLNHTLGGSRELEMLLQSGLISLDYQKTIETQLMQIVQPYEQYLMPVLALLAVGTIQFLNTMVFVVFAATIDIVFLLSKKLGWFKVDYKEVLQEVLSF